MAYYLPVCFALPMFKARISMILYAFAKAVPDFGVGVTAAIADALEIIAPISANQGYWLTNPIAV